MRGDLHLPHLNLQCHPVERTFSAGLCIWEGEGEVLPPDPASQTEASRASRYLVEARGGRGRGVGVRATLGAGVCAWRPCGPWGLVLLCVGRCAGPCRPSCRLPGLCPPRLAGPSPPPSAPLPSGDLGNLSSPCPVSPAGGSPWCEGLALGEERSSWGLSWDFQGFARERGLSCWCLFHTALSGVAASRAVTEPRDSPCPALGRRPGAPGRSLCTGDPGFTRWLS